MRAGWGVVLAGAMLLGVTACSGDDDDKARDGDVVEASDTGGSDDASVAELAAAVESSTAERYRFALAVALGSSTEGEAPLVTGSSDGEQLGVRIDGNSPIAGMLLSLSGEPADWLPGSDADRTVDLVLDGEALYLQSPMFAALRQSPPSAAPPPQAVLDLAAQIGAGWGRVDRSQFEGYLPGPVQDLDPAEGLDAATIEDLLDGLGDLEELDPTEIDGEEMSGFATRASLDEVFEFLAMDPAQVPLLGDFVDGPVGALKFPVEMWLDDEGRFRRLHIPIEGPELAEQADDTDDVVIGVLSGINLDVTLDLSDYGDESIVVEVPTDAVDVGGEFAAALVSLVIGF